MAFNKFGVNIAFACIVLALAVTAATSFYINSKQPAAQTGAMEAPASGTMPADHPKIDISKQVAELSERFARDPQNPEYPAQIANLYYDTGQYETAADYYQRSLKLRPGDPNIETDLAVCFHYTGQDDKALETLDSVLSYSPSFSQALFNKGIILIHAKSDTKEGIRVWEELLRKDPDFARKAELEQKINKLKESIR